MVGFAGEAQPLRAAGIAVVSRRPDLLLEAHTHVKEKEKR